MEQWQWVPNATYWKDGLSIPIRDANITAATLLVTAM